MKILFKILFVLLVSSNLFSQENKPEIMFEKEIHNFGKVEYNSEVAYQFEFKNIGKTPLVIQNIEVSCGCTVVDKPEYPIKPKASDFINVVYNADEEGKFQKSIKIYSNAKNSPVTIYIKGVVLPKQN